MLQQSANHGVVLGLSEEGAGAATKRGIEQALALQSGIVLNVDLDKPVRARKAGNAIIGETSFNSPHRKVGV